MAIEIYPLDKVLIDRIAIHLGMKKSAVEKLIGKGEKFSNKTRCYYLNSEMAIYYNKKKVEFIEFIHHDDGKLKPTIYGVSVFDTQSNNLLQILKEQNNGIIDDHENGYAYYFHNISVGVYRENTPEDAEKMVKELHLNNEGTNKSQIIMNKSNYWSSIGIGVAGYYEI